MTDEPRPDADTAVATETPEAPPAPKLEQQVEIQDIGPCKKHIKVTVERGSIDLRLDGKFSKLVPDSHVAGFRPGKAPRALVQKRFKKEVADEVKAEVLLESLEQLAEDYDIAPLSAPNLDPFKIQLPEKGPLVYEFDVEVRPQFDLPNYKGLKINKPAYTFTDADVEGEKKAILGPYGQVAPKDGPIDQGDVITLDVTAKDGGKTLTSLSDVMVRVEPRLAFKDGLCETFGEKIKGAKAGDSRTLDVALSTAVADEAMRGKTIQAEVKVKDVKIVKLPEMTPEFLEGFGVKTAEQLDEMIRVLLQRRLEYMQRQSARQQVTQILAGSANLDLPQDLLVRQARKTLNRQVMEMQNNGISDDEIRSRSRLLQQNPCGPPSWL